MSNEQQSNKRLSPSFHRPHVELVLCLLALSLAVGDSAVGRGATEASAPTERYELRGVVVSVDKPKKRATVKHEKVGDYMGPMTMPFPVRDEEALSQMQQGDEIKATLVVTPDSGSWLENIVIVSRAKSARLESESRQDPENRPTFLMGTAGNKEPAPSQEAASRFNDTTGLYTCLMHLALRVNTPGKCPKCGMSLISVEPAIPEDFDLRLSVQPRAPQPKQRLKLQLAVFNPRDGAQVKQFALIHEKLLHLFLVSQDLSDFQHIHPAQQPDGTFSIETVLTQAGLYKVYADFYPLEGTPQVLQTNIATAGWKGDALSGRARLQPDTERIKSAPALAITAENADRLGVELRTLRRGPLNDLHVEMIPEPLPPIAGQNVTFKYQLTDTVTGRAVNDLIPYLGAWAHMLILSEDQTDCVHSHPEELVPEETGAMGGGPVVTFNTRLPAPGDYRVWTQFLRGGALFTVAFNIRAVKLGDSR